jgi:hypothetical protein
VNAKGDQARRPIPELLEEINRLGRERDEALARVAELEEREEATRTERRDLRTAVDRLTGGLTEFLDVARPAAPRALSTRYSLCGTSKRRSYCCEPSPSPLCRLTSSSHSPADCGALYGSGRGVTSGGGVLRNARSAGQGSTRRHPASGRA